MSHEPTFSGLPLDESRPVLLELAPYLIPALLLAIDHALQQRILSESDLASLRETRLRIARSL